MRTKFLHAACMLILLAIIFSSCISQRKGPCAPEKMRREIKFKGFL